MRSLNDEPDSSANQMFPNEEFLDDLLEIKHWSKQLGHTDIPNLPFGLELELSSTLATSHVWLWTFKLKSDTVKTQFLGHTRHF